jgi:hypothetical protein
MYCHQPAHDQVALDIISESGVKNIAPYIPTSGASEPRHKDPVQPIFMKFRLLQGTGKISYSEFHPNRSINMESTNENKFTPLNM